MPTPASSSTSTAGGRPPRSIELDAQLPVHARDPRRRPPPCSAAGRQPARDVRGHPAPPVRRRSSRGHADDRAEAIAIARAIRLARAPGRPWSEQAVLVRTHAQTHLHRRGAARGGHPPPRPRRGAAFLDRPEIRRALRDLRDADVPLGTALADLEEPARGAGAGPTSSSTSATTRTTRAAAARPPGRRATPRWPPWSAWAATTCGSTRTAGPTRLAAWLTATVQSEGDAAGPARDAVDVATFHAAKGLEWATVHLAGVEDGFVPIAHARTAAAKAEEVRLLYVAMTRAQRELRISYAEQRTFSGRVVDRRRRRSSTRSVAAPAADARPGHRAGTPDDRPWTTGPTSSPGSARRCGPPAGRSTAGARGPARAGATTAARAARIEPEAVLPDHVLARVAAARPRDVEALGAIARRRSDPRPALRRRDPRRARRSGDVAMRFSDRAAVRRRRRRGGARPTPTPPSTPRSSGCRSCRSPRSWATRSTATSCALQVRYRFGGELSSAARAVIDPARLTWVERSTHDLGRRAHDASRWCPTTTATGSAARARTASRRPTTGSCRRHGEADLTVKALLVARRGGGRDRLRPQEHLVDEVPVVEAFVRGVAR